MYLTRAARCKLIDRYRQYRRQAEIPTQEALDNENADGAEILSCADQTDVSIDISAALRTLTPMQLRLLSLSMEGYTAQEIENILYHDIDSEFAEVGNSTLTAQHRCLRGNIGGGG
jgi:DNA-directed RNA polymerase specialized sigma24 family protein